MYVPGVSELIQESPDLIKLVLLQPAWKMEENIVELADSKEAFG